MTTATGTVPGTLPPQGVDIMHTLVLRQLHCASMEHDRLQQLLGESGAMMNEVRVIWRFKRSVGAWPTL